MRGGHLPCCRSCLLPLLLLGAACEVMLAQGVLLVATSAAPGERAAARSVPRMPTGDCIPTREAASEP